MFVSYNLTFFEVFDSKSDFFSVLFSCFDCMIISVP